MSALKPGDTLYDPVGGARVLLAELTPNGFLVEVRIEPGKPRTLIEHLHKSWTETFEIVRGQGRYSVGGSEHNAEAGLTFTVQPGQTHVHPWNTGTDQLHVRQRSVFEPADPNAAVNTFLGFSTLFGLAREGKTSRKGIPHNPLQLLVILNFFRQHGGYVAGLPLGIQDVLFAGGAALGQAFGYQPWYERFLP